MKGNPRPKQLKVTVNNKNFLPKGNLHDENRQAKFFEEYKKKKKKK